MPSGRLSGAVIALLVSVLAVAPSHALGAVGQPIKLGAGQNPNVTVDSDGTAYIAYTGQGANSKELNFCRLPRAATACATRTTITTPGDSLSIPLAFTFNGTVRVISYRYGGDVPGFSA